MNKQERLQLAIKEYRKLGGRNKDLVLQICVTFDVPVVEFYRGLYER